ncbi:hypothetical protein GGI43DRAFT_380027 [Trichoderma evansii]
MEETYPFIDDEELPRKLPEKTWFYSRDSWTTNRLVPYCNFGVLAVNCILLALILFTTLRTTHQISECSTQAHSNAATNQPSTNASFFATHSGYLTCGHDKKEAKALGCEYDILTNHWLPGQCTDPKSIQDYQADGSWLPYADEARTKPLKVEDLGALDFYYTSMRDHIVHCATLWKRQYRALSEGWKYVDSITAGGEHAHHCAQFLMDMAEVEGYRTEPIKVFVGKSGCHVREN